MKFKWSPRLSVGSEVLTVIESKDKKGCPTDSESPT